MPTGCGCTVAACPASRKLSADSWKASSWALHYGYYIIAKAAARVVTSSWTVAELVEMIER